MNCMKCRRETVDNQVFCAECLADMEKYPVRPGTIIQLPRRREEPAAKKNPSRRKAPPPPEEQVKGLKKQVRRLRAALLIALLLLAIAGYFTAVHIMESDVRLLPGQNYSSVTTGGNTDAE